MADKMTYVEELAEFVWQADYKDLSEEARGQLRIRVLDSLGCCIGALDGSPPVQAVKAQVGEFGGQGSCTLVGGGQEGQEGGGTAPDRAAFYNGALLRY